MVIKACMLRRSNGGFYAYVCLGLVIQPVKWFSDSNHL